MPAAKRVPERVLRMVVGKTEYTQAKRPGAVARTGQAAPTVPDVWAGQLVSQGKGEIPLLPQTRQAADEAG